MLPCRFGWVGRCAFAALIWLLVGSPSFAREGTVSTEDGVKIHYIEQGAGQPLLFVPGWTMPAEIWQRQLEHFSGQYRAIAMDPRAQGRSSQTSSGLDNATRARDIRRIITALGLNRVVLVAWSNGAAEAAAYVSQFGTDRLAGLVFVDGVAGGELDALMVGRIVAGLGKFQTNRIGATQAFVRSMYRTPQSDAYLAAITAASLRTPTASAVAMAVGTLTSNNQAALARIDKPCLIIAPRSPMIPVYEDMRAKITGAQLAVIEGAGHAVFVDAAEQFNALLDQFLRNRAHS